MTGRGWRGVGVVAVLAAGLAGMGGRAMAQQAESFAERWRRRVAEYTRENERLDPAKRYVVLFGSSSTEGWTRRENARYLPAGFDYLNRGISGDGIGTDPATGLLHRLDASVFDCRPSHVFILNGRNSIGRDGSGVAATAAAYERVVAAIRQRLPETVVCVITCAPVNHGYKEMAPHVVRLNAELRAMAAQEGCPLIDLHALLVGEDGLLPSALTRDGLHFLSEGYRRLGLAMAKVLREHPYPSSRPGLRDVLEGAPAGAPR